MDRNSPADYGSVSRSRSKFGTSASPWCPRVRRCAKPRALASKTASTPSAGRTRSHHPPPNHHPTEAAYDESRLIEVARATTCFRIGTGRA
eukprot:365431-Chlamydomonas_euryale.AAC.23